MKFFVFLFTFLVIVSGIYGCQKASAKEKIISPSRGDVWFEAKSYKIKWQGFKRGYVCIDVLLGGKDAGIINLCKTPAKKGYYLWKIPVAFVSGFGINKDDRVRVVLFYKNDENNPIFSDYFTISK